ncbi:MAG: lipid A deacylase LpxR family protein [Bacteroidales bacterium]|nr:lipid A deacylase LpxR family protein [Bacteroidales bacterium]
MFQRVKHILYIATGLFLFACSHPFSGGEDQKEKPGSTQTEIKLLNTRQLANSISPLPFKNGDALLYRSRQKKKIARQVNGNLQDIAPKNAALRTEAEAESFQKEYTQVLVSQNEISHWGLRVIFDNDIWDNTDYYYTNGLAIELITPLAGSSPVNKILLGIKAADIELNGFSIRQNMYTPTNPDVTEVLVNDRPFSSFLTIGHFRETFHFERRLHIKSLLGIGVLGPASLGGTIQSGLHTEEPVGWQNQIQNSLVVNYSVEVEKGIVQTKKFEFSISGNAFAGTLFNKAGGGFSLRLGRFLPVYRGPLDFVGTAGKSKPLQFWFFAKGITDFVLYDATLQGGLFSSENVYIIPPQEMRRFVFQASAGFALYSGNLGIELENFFLSPEFKGGRNFAWGRIKLVAVF